MHRRQLESGNAAAALASLLHEGERQSNLDLCARQNAQSDLGLEAPVVGAAVQPLKPNGRQLELEGMPFGDVRVLDLDGPPAVGVVEIRLGERGRWCDEAADNRQQ